MHNLLDAKLKTLFKRWDFSFLKDIEIILNNSVIFYYSENDKIKMKVNWCEKAMATATFAKS